MWTDDRNVNSTALNLRRCRLLKRTKRWLRVRDILCSGVADDTTWCSATISENLFDLPWWWTLDSMPGTFLILFGLIFFMTIDNFRIVIRIAASGKIGKIHSSNCPMRWRKTRCYANKWNWTPAFCHLSLYICFLFYIWLQLIIIHSDEFWTGCRTVYLNINSLSRK